MNTLKRFWKWFTTKSKVKTMEDILYDNMWHQLNLESHKNNQLEKDNKNISDNLRLAGFDLD